MCPRGATCTVSDLTAHYLASSVPPSSALDWGKSGTHVVGFPSAYSTRCHGGIPALLPDAGVLRWEAEGSHGWTPAEPRGGCPARESVLLERTAGASAWVPDEGRVQLLMSWWGHNQRHSELHALVSSSPLLVSCFWC